MQGALAQLVEQRTENPCVPSSILGGTTGRREGQGVFPFFMIFSLLLKLKIKDRITKQTFVFCIPIKKIMKSIFGESISK